MSQPQTPMPQPEDHGHIWFFITAFKAGYHNKSLQDAPCQCDLCQKAFYIGLEEFTRSQEGSITGYEQHEAHARQDYHDVNLCSKFGEGL